LFVTTNESTVAVVPSGGIDVGEKLALEIVGATSATAGFVAASQANMIPPAKMATRATGCHAEMANRNRLVIPTALAILGRNPRFGVTFVLP
jgi:hypothetical protein